MALNFGRLDWFDERSDPPMRVDIMVEHIESGAAKKLD